MAERAVRRQPDAERKKGQPQREVLETVQRIQTPEQGPHLELAPDIPETLPEIHTYTPGESLELMAEDGTPETWLVVSCNSEDGEVFLQRVYDTQTAPSLEIVHHIELSLEQATLPIAELAGEAWDSVVERYANVPGSLISAEDFRRSVAKHKGKILRTAAWEIYQNHPDILQQKNPSAIAGFLDKIFSQYLIQESKKKIDSDPRHKEADNLRTLADYFKVLTELREPNKDSAMGEIISDLIDKKIALLHGNRRPHTLITELEHGYDEVPMENISERRKASPEEIKAQVLRAWEDLRSQIKLTEQTLHFTDPTSAQSRGLYAELEKKLHNVNIAEIVLNDARLRTELEPHPHQDEELAAWETMKAQLEKIPRSIRTSKKKTPTGTSIPKETSKPAAKTLESPLDKKLPGKISRWFQATKSRFGF